jgi:hypothetical protein
MSARKEIIMERIDELMRLAREAELRGGTTEPFDTEIKVLREEFSKLNADKQLLKG